MLALKNQFIFAPIKTGYSDGSGLITEKHLAFYKRRSQYLGAVIPEPFLYGKKLRGIAKNLSLKMMKEKRTIFSDYTHIKKIGNAQHAIRDGYETAKVL